MSDINVYLPIDIRDVPPLALAPRPTSLKGLRVGFLDNGKEFTDVVYEGLKETLEKEFGITNVSIWEKGFPSKICPFIDEMAANIDVAISGVGH